MKFLSKFNLFILTLLGIASGTAKIMQLPEEMEFFQAAGFSSPMILLFGATQLISSVLMIFQKTRRPGAVILAVTFIISTVLIFMGGKIGFGLFSVVPILLLTFVIVGKSEST